MEDRVIGPGPYRATKLWNETITLFRNGMPLRRHRIHFRSYDGCFTASEAVDWLHELLRRNQNFGPEVTKAQTLQLLKKFLKNHVIEDIKGRWGNEDFQDNGHLYRFPPSSPLKPYPKKSYCKENAFTLKFPKLGDYEPVVLQDNAVRPLVLNSEDWNKRHSIAIGEVPECRLVHRKEISSRNVEQIWKTMTLTNLQKILGLDSLDGLLDSHSLNSKNILHNVYKVNKQGVVILEDKSEELPHWVLSAMKCLANWPNGGELKQPMYPGFERDVLKTVADYFQKQKEPLLTFKLYDTFVSILGLLQKQQVATEALQVCCLLLPRDNRRRLQLLMRMMTKICRNIEIPPLNNAIGNRTLMVQTFSRCILRSEDEVDLDELLATKLVTFMMDNSDEILKVPGKLQTMVEEHLSHLRRVQIKYAGADADASFVSHSYCKRISKEEFEEQRTSSAQVPMAELLEEIIKDTELSVKEKKKKLKQFQQSYPEVYRKRFPTVESEKSLFPEKPKIKPQLMFFALKKPFQPFQRTRSFRT
ncbi:DEP domain-containing protein 1B-like isoform X1 [Erpetoichthys calabaricus]|uniref:DEP domain-containing protein 1B n=1 Tax=Erpetoichthys calabaricus TaxID=27687 RepID=A0A8C4S6L7_ERPCA|nr:DEP domain-containing protein 1B-like isoform X1 [Erpetoichthys calabaricus]